MATQAQCVLTTAPQSSRPELGTHQFIHDQAVRVPSDGEVRPLHQLIESCSNAAVLELGLEEELYNAGILSDKNKAMLKLESIILDMAATPSLTEGVFYCLVFKFQGHFIIRHIASGRFEGFVDKGGKALLEEELGFGNMLFWDVYNATDIQKRKQYLKKKTQDTKKHSNKQQYHRLLTKRTDSITNCLNQFPFEATNGEVTAEYLIVHTVRQCPSKDEADRFLHTRKALPEKTTVQKRNDRFHFHWALNEAPQVPSMKLIELEGNMEKPTLEEQFRMLSKISNYHWWQYPRLDDKRSQVKPTVSLLQHLIYHPSVDPDTPPRQLPLSPRNRLLYLRYAILHDHIQACSPLTVHIKYIMAIDQGTEPEFMPTSADGARTEVVPSDLIDEVLPVKRRCSTKRAVHVTRKELQDMTHNLNNNRFEISQYKQFKERVMGHDGTLLLRTEAVGERVYILSDYDITTGDIKPGSFVHLRASENQHDQYLQCKCSTYAFLKGTSVEEEDVLAMDSPVTCMHCRIFLEDLQATSDISTRTKAASSAITNAEVVPLGQVNVRGCSKFSVLGEGSISFVHMSDGNVRCTSGTCAAQMRNRKKMPKLLNFVPGEAHHFCNHLCTIMNNPAVWKDAVPDGMSCTDAPSIETDDETHDATYHDVDAAPNVEALDVTAPIECPFSTDTGLWDFGGKSQHKPKPMLHLQFQKETQSRNQICDGPFKRSVDGLLISVLNDEKIRINLDPSPRQECLCGAGYPDPVGTCDECQQPCQCEKRGNVFTKDYTTTLYTRNGPVACQVWKQECVSQNPNCTLTYSGEQNAIHFLTSNTCMGDEIGWDFCRRVMGMKTSFSAFCDEMTATYKSIHICSAPFMSKGTFIKWFFSWGAKMRIDFRKEVDPYCGYHPKVLVCDGTHVGISNRHNKITNHVTDADMTHSVWPSHKIDRVFLPYTTYNDHKSIREAREYLHRKCKEALGTLNYVWDDGEEETLQQAVLHLLQQMSDDRPLIFVKRFLLRGGEATARVLLMLASDAPVSAVLPPRYHNHLTQVCQSVLGGNDTSVIVPEMYEYAPEVASLVTVTLEDGWGSELANFLLYLIQFVQTLHSKELQADKPKEIGEYNPRCGAAHYFTEKGTPIRQIPHYQIASGAKYDDAPIEACKKTYAKVSYGGYSYIFLWFCGLHGHCYGFHVINGSEGRKDPFCSLVKYLPEAPQELFYDFACGLQEYALNRQPAYFRNTRVWHDVFHGFVHKCAACYKSKRLTSLQHINTEISEQFNAFLQCIKYTASHLSQDHFIFFVQFFIHQWNVKKTERFDKIIEAALAGCS